MRASPKKSISCESVSEVSKRRLRFIKTFWATPLFTCSVKVYSPAASSCHYAWASPIAGRLSLSVRRYHTSSSGQTSTSTGPPHCSDGSPCGAGRPSASNKLVRYSERLASCKGQG
jgi:hypothetical protein